MLEKIWDPEEGAALVEERAREGAAQGEGVWGIEAEEGQQTLVLSLVLRPQVPMGFYQSLPAVAALAVLDGLEAMGAEGLGLAWPAAVVADGTVVASIRMRAGYGEGGMFAASSVRIALERCFAEGAMPEAEEAARRLQEALVSGMKAWEAGLASNGAGPLAPVLERYFDRIALMGKQVDVVYPNGRVRAQGRFAGVDIWGRATVVTADGEDIEFSPEEASIRG